MPAQPDVSAGEAVEATATQTRLPAWQRAITAYSAFDGDGFSISTPAPAAYSAQASAASIQKETGIPRQPVVCA